MRQGTIENGFSYEIDEEQLNDYEFIELLAEAEKDLLAFVRVAKRLLGEEQHAALKEHLRDENGRIDPLVMADSIRTIMEDAGDETKNS